MDVLFDVCQLLVIFVIDLKFKAFKNFIYGNGIRTPVVNMTIILFGAAQSKVPNKNFSRFLLNMFLLFCLVLRNVYQGSMFTFLQSDGPHKEVQSINEMVEKGFEF